MPVPGLSSLARIFSQFCSGRISQAFKSTILQSIKTLCASLAFWNAAGRVGRVTEAEMWLGDRPKLHHK